MAGARQVHVRVPREGVQLLQDLGLARPLVQCLGRRPLVVRGRRQVRTQHIVLDEAVHSRSSKLYVLDNP